MNLDALERPHQPRRQFVKLARMIAGEAVQNLPAFASEAQDGATLVVGVRLMRSSKPSRSERSTSSTTLLCFRPRRSAA